jgi:hypothetical protein
LSQQIPQAVNTALQEQVRELQQELADIKQTQAAAATPEKQEQPEPMRPGTLAREFAERLRDRIPQPQWTETSELAGGDDAA